MKTTAIPVSLLQSSSEARLATHLPDFVVTLTKPRVTELAVFTAFVGMIIAPGHLHPPLGSIAVLAIAGGAGDAGVLTMWCDADIDAVVTRWPPAAFLIQGADGQKARHEPRAGQAPRRRPMVASAPR
jgi:protoheme IX farnesyltransferase